MTSPTNPAPWRFPHELEAWIATCYARRPPPPRPRRTKRELLRLVRAAIVTQTDHPTETKK